MPEGTRFIVFDDRRSTGIALALGFALGAIVVALSGQRPVAKRRWCGGGSSIPLIFATR
jgi:hypothetical protein